MKDENNSLDDFTKYDIFEKWKKLQNFPTLGMFNALTKDYNEYLEDMQELSRILMDLQKYLSNYWMQMSKTQFHAIGNVLLKSRSDPKLNDPDSERFRHLVIDAFEEAYSSLFSSKEFAVAYNEVYSKQLDFVNCINKIVERNLNLLNIPTRTELDEVLKDLQEMKKTLRNIKNAYEKPERK
ncbi:MAG: poly(R)-hydroxyalkanoic acid synthase subunit PhaE [Nitrososphaeraceae archaeon]|nr:poly(R)-hydroxyalkanoic acid synthase subunit PhaE [Nitrososphaeraceae archaeon]MDW0153310.1 poly(R)-hydroxyalkanoic acid synthase subunit PhaE [Nitrososphaeraceae archaeon]MDW0167656.1 poly(R)-hydroxyalkanoic acid synthase subunit PhaE [Nitrososphaeraceae archaeon]MDW3654311.1 poly(R)-hydroxyalkanoic acid synthase subunit PhaE [Nitrososphaeraceae archaeon]